MSFEEALELLKRERGCWSMPSERLPDDDKEVLLCINNGELWLGWHNITWKTEEFYFDKEQVIAWMPLPEPYKGGEM